ncbi:MAG: PD-(D/E)XK nuclease family protein [Clostridiales bacterium]|nr:PD-(D/E)XK nuclease family protein [Clostridiales bacterium]
MQDIRMIGARNGRLWPAVLKAAEKARREGRAVILYVPEQLTLQTERDLITGLRLPGLLDIDVISPRKLREQVRETAGCSALRPLDDFGSSMAVHRAMTECAGELTYYRSMTGLPGAVERVREALGELRESGMTAEELEEYAGKVSGGAEKARLGDLARIWRAWDALTEARFEDGKAAWTDMVSRLRESRIWKNAEVLVYGFDSIRPDLRELLLGLCGQAGGIQVFLTMDVEEAPDGRIFGEQRRSVKSLREEMHNAGYSLETEFLPAERPGTAVALEWLDRRLFAEETETWKGDPGEEVTLFAAADPSGETEDIARTLRKWHREGIAWQRMAVCLPKGSGLDSALQGKLRQNGIPFFRTEKTPAAAHGVCRMLLGALGCISDDYSTSALMDAARSGFSTLSDAEALRLENYALAHGIDRHRWREPFRYGDNAEEMEEIRLKLTGPIEKLREELKAAKDAAGSVRAIVRFLEAEGVWERLEEREKRLTEAGLYREAVVDRQVWKLLTEMLDQLWALLGERRALLRDLRSMLESALSTASIASLPEQETGVSIGEVGHMLPGDVDALILAGVREGLMSVPESGWMNDRERSAMERATGKEIGISRERRGTIRRFDIYRTVSLPRLRLRITRSIRDESGASGAEDELITRIKSLMPALKEEGSAVATESGACPDSPQAQLEEMGGLIRALREGGAAETENWESALVRLMHDGEYGRTAREMLRSLRGEGGKQRIEPETARRLFMTDQVSISRLEGYAACPYKHFIEYGLRPVQRENFTFESNDAGNFFHAALDRYLKTAGGMREWPGLTKEQADGIMDRVCAELTREWERGPLGEDALGVWQGEDYLRRVHFAAWTLTRFAANSDFKTIATEQSFGAGGELPPLILKMKDGSRVAVRGTIDRIDTWETGEGIWLRVVDNKSRGKKPEAAKMETGEQLQLMIYLKAAAGAIPGSRPAGALFFPVQDPEIGPETDDEGVLEAERIKEVRMKGLVTAEESVIRAMDRDRQPFSVDAVFRQDGTVSAKAANFAVDEGTMNALMDAAAEKAAELCGEIREGLIGAAPRGEGDDTACRYCDYRTVCHARREDARPRNKGITCRDIVGKNLRETPKEDIITEEKNP